MPRFLFLGGPKHDQVIALEPAPTFVYFPNPEPLEASWPPPQLDLIRRYERVAYKALRCTTLWRELFTVYCFEGMPEHEAFEYVRDILVQIGELPPDLGSPVKQRQLEYSAAINSAGSLIHRAEIVPAENRFFLARSLVEANREFNRRLFRSDYARATLANRYRLAHAKA